MIALHLSFSLLIRKLRLRVSNLQEIKQIHRNEVGIRIHFVQFQSMHTSPHDSLPTCHPLGVCQERIVKAKSGSGDLKSCARVCSCLPVCFCAGWCQHPCSFLFPFLSPKPPPLLHFVYSFYPPCQFSYSQYSCHMP